jgi:PAS domain-containing protein
MDEDLRFSYFSERFTEITGVPQEALLGKTRQETGIPNVDENEWRKHLADLAARRPFRSVTEALVALS